ncbi:MAG TPA: hypothetical protein VD907_05335 [Verrucomicrobiae bacterium]|nr:hypothetical protein [Verrucomicrobiae bacterium]
MATKVTALKKRQQIAAANRSVFVWTAVAAIIVAFSLVLLQFLLQQMVFNERVLNEKRHTDHTLSQNLQAADKLKEEVNVLLANSDLASVRAKPTDSNLNVVLDALPAELDSLNLGSSLQSVFLAGTVRSIERLSVTSLEQNAPSEEDTVVEDASISQTTHQPQEIGFSFTVSGDYNNIRNALLALERSIRPIQVSSITIEGSDSNLTASVEAKTFYQPAKKVELKDKTVQP